LACAADPWAGFFSAYATLFLREEVSDAGVLREMRERHMGRFFRSFVKTARASGASMCAEWVEKLEDRRAKSDGGREG
jgi:hypothetical protein